MFKKNQFSGTRAGIIAASLLASSVAFAGGPEVAPAPAVPFGTFFVGAGLSHGGDYVSRSSPQDFFDLSTTPPTLTLSIRDQSKYGGTTGYAGEFFFGFATRYWHNFNLALDLSVSAAPNTRSEVDTSDEHNPIALPVLIGTFEELYLNPTFGANLELGYLLQPDVTAYGLVGYSLARGSLREYSSLAGDNVNTLGLSVPLQTYDITRRKNLNGISAGLGFTVKVASNTSLGFGYTWTDYDSIQNVVNVQDLNPLINTSGVISANRSPETEVFNLSLIYAFAPVTPFSPAEKARQGGEFYAAVFADRDNSFTTELNHEANPRNPAAIPPAVFAFNNFLTHGNFASDAWGVEGLIGYGYTLSSGAYLGAEAFYNAATSSYPASFTQTTPPGVGAASAGSTTTNMLRLRLKDSFGLALVPGYKIDRNILVFAKLGVAERDLQRSAVETNTATTPGALRNTRIGTVNESYDAYGYQVGAGFDVRLTHNLFLRNEYVVTTYSNVKTRHRSDCCSGNGFNGFLVGEDISDRTVSGTYKLGLEYKLPV